MRKHIMTLIQPRDQGPGQTGPFFFVQHTELIVHPGSPFGNSGSPDFLFLSRNPDYRSLLDSLIEGGMKRPGSGYNMQTTSPKPFES